MPPQDTFHLEVVWVSSLLLGLFMFKLFLPSVFISTIIMILLLSGCSDTTPKTDAQRLMNNPTEVKIDSVKALQNLFEKQQYKNVSSEKGSQEIPRITFSAITDYWQESSHNLPVKEKKEIFFRLMLPLILIANEKINLERETIKNSALDSKKLKALALKYRLIKDERTNLDEVSRKNLLERVDIIPPSLALAQAAEESGWATSRFAKEGNAFFGQWDFSGNGMKPKQHRAELGDYGVARFDSPLASVEGYMFNLNSAKAYQALRDLRAKLHAEKQPVTGLKLTDTLDKYSERGDAYTQGLRSMINYNKLQKTDQAYLANNKLIHIINK